MKIDISIDKDANDAGNTMRFDSLTEDAYKADLKEMADPKNLKIEALDTLIVPTTSDQHKHRVIHLTSSGSFVIHHINKNQSDSSTKIYKSIIDPNDLYEEKTKYLYYNQKLDCLFVKLRNSIVLLSLRNFKNINKIIERTIDADVKLNIIQNKTYVVLSYQAEDSIKFFIWDSVTTRYLRLKIFNLLDITKKKQKLKSIGLEFVDEVDTDVLLLFENDIILYNFDSSTVKNGNLPLKVIHNPANNRHSEIIKLIDLGPSATDNDSRSIRSRRKKTIYVKFVGLLKDSESGIIRVIDNKGNVYIHNHINKNLLRFEDKILLENENDIIDYFEPDFRNNKTLFVFTNNGKNVDICFNNYSVVYLETSTSAYKNNMHIIIINDFIILLDHIQKCITVAEIDYNDILGNNILSSKPMNLINLINKIYAGKSRKDISGYLDLIRNAYSRLLIVQQNLAKTNDMVLQFFNNKAIKYLLPLDIVIQINSDKDHYEKEFINYLLEIKRYLLNIQKGDAEKYNFFFDNKVIVDNYDFFLYNEMDSDDGLNDMFEIIDARLLDYYIDKDIDLVNIFVNSGNNKCLLKTDYILTKLLNLLKSNKKDNFVSILKIIITFCIRNERYKQGFDIILNLNQFIVHIDIPQDYLFKVSISYLIEMFGYLLSHKDVVVTEPIIDLFFEMVSEAMALNSEIVNNSLYLKSIFLQSNKDINFDNLDKNVFAKFCTNIRSLKPKTFYRDFLEFYVLVDNFKNVDQISFSNNNNVILSTLISYYIETDDFFTFPSILNKLHDLLNDNIKRCMPFEVMSLLNDKESSFTNGWENEKWYKKYMQIKCLVWKEMQEDNKILQYFYQDKENGFGMCLKYIKNLSDEPQRYSQAIQYLGKFMSDNYQEWMVYIHEFAEFIEIKTIPGFIKISDLNTLMLKSILNKCDHKTTFKNITKANNKIANTQMSYLNNKKLNEFTEIN